MLIYILIASSITWKHVNNNPFLEIKNPVPTDLLASLILNGYFQSNVVLIEIILKLMKQLDITII